jgi:hypothetical protein
MEITILVKSSSQTEPRSVLVRQDDSGLTIACDCPAGERGRICKHKRAMMSADDRMLYDEGQKENFKQVIELVTQSGYSDLMSELKKAESELGSAKQNVWRIKEKISSAMNEGLK